MDLGPRCTVQTQRNIVSRNQCINGQQADNMKLCIDCTNPKQSQRCCSIQLRKILRSSNEGGGPFRSVELLLVSHTCGGFVREADHLLAHVLKLGGFRHKSGKQRTRKLSKVPYITCFFILLVIQQKKSKTTAVLLIRIRMFLGLLDPNPLVRATDPDPSIIKHKSKQNLDSYYFVTSFLLFIFEK